MEAIWAVGGALVGAIFVAWRLRGDGGTLQTLLRVVRYDSPKPGTPK